MLIAFDFHAGEYESLLPRCEELLDQLREKRAWDNVMEVYCLSLDRHRPHR